MSADSHTTETRQAAIALQQKLPQPTAGRLRILITGGPTHEDIDPVRFIGNRSSGRMGLELALAAQSLGHQPVLILGPTALVAPEDLPVLTIRSTRQLQAAVTELFPFCQALIMAAAPADYRPAHAATEKIHKRPGDWDLTLTRNPDILSELPKESGQQVVVGFSLTTDQNLPMALEKRRSKQMDMIVANTNNSFAGDGTDALLIGADETPEPAPPTKAALARLLIERIEALWTSRKETP